MPDNLVSQAAFRHPHATALVSQDGQRISFARLDAHVTALAARLAAEGIGPGQTVAPVADNRALRIMLIFALMRAGAEVAMIAAPAPLERTGQRLDAIVALPGQAVVAGARRLDFTEDWFAARPPAVGFPDPSQPAVIAATSGSTGSPKFLRLPSSALLRRVAALEEVLGPSRGPHLIAMPETSVVALIFVLRAFAAGHGAIGMLDRAAATLAAAAELGVAEMALTPLALAALLDPAVSGGPAPPRPTRVMVVGAAADGALLGQAGRHFGGDVMVLAGAAEIGPYSGGRYQGDWHEPGWSGAVLPSIEARAGRDGEVARLALRLAPETRAEGYLGGPPIHDADGWFETGDLARIRADGALVFAGRADNLINLGGAKFAAELVEMLAGQCPGVVRAAAMRLDPPGSRVAELGIAAVAGPGFDAEQVRLFLAGKLRTTAPIRVLTVGALPELPSGKLDRKALAALFG